jgi:GNAT superfamily N-acetyltransferase
MSLKIQTRIGKVDDAEAISDFVSKLAKHHVAVTLDQNGVDSLLTSMNVKATRNRICGDYHFILASEEDRLVGVATISNPSHLYYLFVETDDQRKGVGRHLFQQAQEYVYRTTGSRSMTVNSSLNAIEAYCRFGFKKVGNIETTDGVRYQPMRWRNAT